MSAAKIWERNHYNVWVRESGPDAYGGQVCVEAGELYRRREEDNWTLCEEKTYLWMEFADSHLEVLNSEKGTISIYDAYED